MIWSAAVAINELPLDHEHIQAFLDLRDDINPGLTTGDGTTVGLHDPEQVLGYGIAFLDQGPPSLLRDGVLARLKVLEEAWHGQVGPKAESTPSSME
jgi:hypothetical protein